MSNKTALSFEEAIAITDKHIELWNETDESRHAELISNLYSSEIEMVDSLFIAEGHTGVKNAIAGFQTNRPDSRFSKAKDIEHHHNIIRMYWHNGPAEMPDAAGGMDLFVIENGLVAKLYVFVDSPKF